MTTTLNELKELALDNLREVIVQDVKQGGFNTVEDLENYFESDYNRYDDKEWEIADHIVPVYNKTVLEVFANDPIDINYSYYEATRNFGTDSKDDIISCIKKGIFMNVYNHLQEEENRLKQSIIEEYAEELEEAIQE